VLRGGSDDSLYETSLKTIRTYKKNLKWYFHQNYKIETKETFQNVLWNSKYDLNQNLYLNIHQKDVVVSFSLWERRSLDSFLRKEHVDISRNNFHSPLQNNTKVTFLFSIIRTLANMRGNFLPRKVKTFRFSFTLHTFLKWKLIDSYKRKILPTSFLILETELSFLPLHRSRIILHNLNNEFEKIIINITIGIYLCLLHHKDTYGPYLRWSRFWSVLRFHMNDKPQQN